MLHTNLSSIVQEWPIDLSVALSVSDSFEPCYFAHLSMPPYHDGRTDNLCEGTLLHGKGYSPRSESCPSTNRHLDFYPFS